MAASVSPPCARAMACSLLGVSLGLRPNLTPRAFALALPSPVRDIISERSNSEIPPNTVSMRRPCGVVVSAHVSDRLLNPAPAFAIVSSMFSRSRVLRARRSRRVTIKMSPSCNSARALVSSGRLAAKAPLIFSAKILSHPAAWSCEC